MRADLHTHSIFSDGELIPAELVRRAQAIGHDAIAITDHVDMTNVEWVVKNVIKQETMETDTLYWDQAGHEIFTDCYVKLYSPSGFMQGYGMRSDEMARNSIIHRPFDSYGVVVQDSTEVVIDTANFIGPLMKK